MHHDRCLSLAPEEVVMVEARERSPDWRIAKLARPVEDGDAAR
jgi:hypothetical protein